MTALRNVLIHDYERVDLQKVWRVVEKSYPRLRPPLKESCLLSSGKSPVNKLSAGYGASVRVSACLDRPALAASYRSLTQHSAIGGSFSERTDVAKCGRKSMTSIGAREKIFLFID